MTKDAKPATGPAHVFAGPDEFLRAVHGAFTRRFPASGGSACSRSLRVRSASREIENLGADGKRTANGMKTESSLIVRALVNDAGLRRLSDSHVDMLLTVDSATVSTIFEVCRKHCGIATRDVDAIAALRAIAKNSEAAQARVRVPVCLAVRPT